MTKEERRICINWMLNQIDAIEIAMDDAKLGDDTLLSQCGVSNRVHVYGKGFHALAEATNARPKREDFDEKTWRLSFMFCGVEFMCLEDKEYANEEQAE